MPLTKTLRHGRTPYPGLALLLSLGVLGLFWMQGCAPKAPPPKRPPLAPETVWSTFRQTYAKGTDQPFRLKGSVNYASPAESHRFGFEMWGHTELPLRLDLKASLGMTFSMWRLDEQGWTAYYPRQETAYMAPDTSLAVRRLGFPSPFTLQELARLLTGQWTGLVPEEFIRSSRPQPGSIEYAFPSTSRISHLSLSREGRILSMSGSRPFAWTLECTDYEQVDNRFLPSRYRLRTAREQKAVLNIKDVTFRTAPWPHEALTFPLPEGTKRLPLGSNPSPRR